MEKNEYLAIITAIFGVFLIEWAIVFQPLLFYPIMGVPSPNLFPYPEYSFVVFAVAFTTLIGVLLIILAFALWDEEEWSYVIGQLIYVASMFIPVIFWIIYGFWLPGIILLIIPAIMFCCLYKLEKEVK
jgi:hypothetical protein